jgi:hypothetical protein
MPERIATGTTPVVLKSGVTPLTGAVDDDDVDPTGRIVTFPNPLDYTNPGDWFTVTYKAVRPFPINGEQVIVFFNTRAPQTSRAVSPSYLTSLSVVPKCIPKTLYTLTAGVSSPDAGYPFPTAYVQTGGVNAPSFLGVGAGEYGLTAESNISISDFSADTGMLALPIYVPLTPNPDQVTFSSPLTTGDTEGRTAFTTAGSNYLPNAFAQDLSDPKHHKNFLPFLAELSADSPPLGFKGQLVLVLLTRWADNDETNGVFFGSGSTTAASVFRLRNNMLNKSGA